MAATEEYPPNVRLATEKLAPLRVAVVVVRLTTRDPMTFVDGEFDLVANRHSSFNTGEVAHILSPSDTFFLHAAGPRTVGAYLAGGVHRQSTVAGVDSRY